MTVTVDLKPEVEERILAEAEASGLSVEDYILNVLEREIPNGEENFARTASPEKWVKAFHEWIDIPRPPHPPLSDYAVSRESIYSREDEML